MKNFGEENKASIISKAIVSARQKNPITSTKQLADIISNRLPRPQKTVFKSFSHPATKTFQALRIYINDELYQLFLGIYQAEKLLLPGGVLCFVTFHSLEDRILKKILNFCSKNEIEEQNSFLLLSKKASI